jgi:hypothetical protein
MDNYDAVLALLRDKLSAAQAEKDALKVRVFDTHARVPPFLPVPLPSSAALARSTGAVRGPRASYVSSSAPKAHD